MSSQNNITASYQNPTSRNKTNPSTYQENPLPISRNAKLEREMLYSPKIDVQARRPDQFVGYNLDQTISLRCILTLHR